jgi:hypothetical protein
LNLPPRVANTKKIGTITKILPGLEKSVVNDVQVYLTSIVRNEWKI